MLRFDRYLGSRSPVLDLATGRRVDLSRWRTADRDAALFESRRGRTLIDLDAAAGRRVEIWERWAPMADAHRADAEIADFVELLECARDGAPRVYDMRANTAAAREYLTRVFAREARVRGWIPVSSGVLGELARGGRAPGWSADRSLVIFSRAPESSVDAVAALMGLARRDSRPHVLVRTVDSGVSTTDLHQPPPPALRSVLHEASEPFAVGLAPADGTPADLKAESRARWAVMLDGIAGTANTAARQIELARVLAARDQTFEARALIEGADPRSPALTETAAAVVAGIESSAARRFTAGDAGPSEGGARGWEMVDDFVGVLQMCQDIEDEQTALARVGAFLRERLQASAVAFVAREGRATRVVARVGSDAGSVDVAVRSIETGVPIPAPRPQGPAESACPVRHAAEVIGALWCRWSAGMPIAVQQASTLLGLAAAASAPSLRLVLAKIQPTVDRANLVPELIGESAAIVAVKDAIVRAAHSPFPVVIEGESGSGKELAARAIHTRSARRDRRFSAVNCAALVDDLVEAELFGHVKGAFTGAGADRQGLFEEATGGTLFLDEVAELGPRVQAKLLRALQEGEIRRLGETFVRKVDVRLVAATNRPLAAEVGGGRFRADLWYRLDVIRVTLPPLRERLEDLPLLVQHLWRTLAARTGSRAALSPSTVGALAAYDWPGNIRELQNALASMLVAAPRSGLIRPAALPVHIARAAAIERGATLADARRQFEMRYVKAALARAGGRPSTAARDLGISRQGLAKLMGRLGIDERVVEAAN